MKKYLNLATFYLVLGLVGGVFFREFTKINGFEGTTTLRALHPHALMLGFFMFIIIMMLEKSFTLSQSKHFGKWLVLYNISLIYVWVALLIRGVVEVKGLEFVGLNHIAGLGHALLGVSLVWFVVILHKVVGKEAAK